MARAHEHVQVQAKPRDIAREAGRSMPEKTGTPRMQGHDLYWGAHTRIGLGPHSLWAAPRP